MKLLLSRIGNTLIFCALLSLIPVMRVVSIVSSTCSNVLYFDFVHSIGVINSALSNRLSYSTFLQDFSLGGHPQVAPLMFHIMNARLFGLNALWEGYFCVALMCISTLITFVLFVPKSGSSWRFALLPILSLIQFSLCLSSEFFYPYVFANDAINRLAFGLGILAIARIKNPFIAGCVVMVCGLISATCAAGFVVSCWVSFIFAAICLRRFERSFWGCVLSGWILSFVPMLMVQLSGTSRFDPGTSALAPIGRFLTAISLALMNDTASEILVTIVTIACGLLGLFFVGALTVGAFARRVSTVNIVCCLSYALFGLLNLLAVSVARQYLRPWYCSFSVFFWEAVVSLAFILLLKGKFSKAPRVPSWPTVLSVSAIGFFACFYFLTNRTYADKDWFRNLHSPAAESNLRSFLWAPTYAASSYDSLAEYWKFGREVSLHNLSCFDSHQVWLMQGDFGLPTVITGKTFGDQSVHWLRGRKSSTRAEYTVPEHLFLSLPGGTYVNWVLNLPNSLKAATAMLDVCTSDNEPTERKLVVRILDRNGQLLSGPLELRAQRNSKLYKVPLSAFRGKEIIILIENLTLGQSGSKPILVNCPKVDCRFEKANLEREIKNSLVNPCNVDNSTDQFGTVSEIKCLSRDFCNDWDKSNLRLEQLNIDGTAGFVALNDQAHLINKKPIDIKPSEWHDFFFEAASPVGLRHGFFFCEFILNSGRVKRAIIPVLPDGLKHKYTYQLKVIEAFDGEIINFVQIYPIYSEGQKPHSVRIGRVGFLKRDYRCLLGLTSIE